MEPKMQAEQVVPVMPTKQIDLFAEPAVPTLEEALEQARTLYLATFTPHNNYIPDSLVNNVKGLLNAVANKDTYAGKDAPYLPGRGQS